MDRLTVQAYDADNMQDLWVIYRLIFIISGQTYLTHQWKVYIDSQQIPTP